MAYSLIELESEQGDRYARPTLPTSSFGANVKRLRRARHMNQSDLAERLGVKQATLSGWETDRRGLPEGPTLVKFAKALSTPIEDLLAGVDDEYDAVVAAARTNGPAVGEPSSGVARQIRLLVGQLASAVTGSDATDFLEVWARLDESDRAAALSMMRAWRETAGGQASSVAEVQPRAGARGVQRPPAVGHGKR